MILRDFQALAVVAALAFMLLLSIARPANASCALATEDGRWENIDPETNGVTRIEIVMNCQDVILDDKPWPPSFPWYIRVFEQCGANDCDWGKVGANDLDSRHILAVFEREEAQVRVYLRIDPTDVTLLSAYVFTDFDDPGRADSGHHYWFRNPHPYTCTVPVTRQDWKKLSDDALFCTPERQDK